MKITEGLTFDDVLLVPQRSAVVSRKDVDLKTKISRNITLNTPVISANMDTVTGSGMAIAMARVGAFGIIHRFLPIEAEVAEVYKVKRAENYRIYEPFTIGPNTTLAQILSESKKHDIHSFVVVDGRKKVLGIVTSRDYTFENNLSKKARQLMTPRKRLVAGKPSTTILEAQEFFRKHKIEKLPLVQKDGTLAGMITSKDLRHRLNPFATRDKLGRLMVGAAVGIRGDYLERSEELIRAGCDLLCIDVAHGHLETCLSAVKALRRKFPNIDLMAGNVATAKGARDLVRSGADSIKVGVGGGSTCITRLQTGSGVPQLTAIIGARKGAGKLPIIADGGMRNSGDLTKALAAGANAGMFGSLLAGTDEAPGEIVMWNGRRSKLYRGMASLGAHIDRKKTEGGNGNEVLSDFVAEGADQAAVPYRGSVREVLSQLAGGVRSGMSYVGSHTISELWKNAEFVKMTPAGVKESGVHDVEY